MKQGNSRRLLVFGGIAVASVVCGVAVGALGGLIGAALMRGQLPGFGDLAGALMGIIIGYPVGVLIFFIVLRKAFKRRGSLVKGIAGTVIGAVAVMGLSEPLNLNVTPEVLFITFFLVSSMLGTVGFYLGRGKKYGGDDRIRTGE
ncbi:hypothetical protein ACFLYV_02030 [Chloroflexota bacterium]